MSSCVSCGLSTEFNSQKMCCRLAKLTSNVNKISNSLIYKKQEYIEQTSPTYYSAGSPSYSPNSPSYSMPSPSYSPSSP